MSERGAGADLHELVTEPESFFTGLTVEQCQTLLAAVERRHVDAGRTVVRAGDESDLRVILSGSAEVFLTDAAGAERRLRVVGPGQSLGEMSLFTSERATASARALTDLELLCIAPDEFHRLAGTYPQLYMNLGAIVAERLSHANRRVLGEPSGRVTLLVDQGAPAELAPALAASIAWHTRGAVLLVDVSDGPADEDLRPPLPRLGHAVRCGAAAEGGRPALHEAIERLRRSFDHIIVRASARGGALVPADRRLVLVPDGAGSDDATCDYPILAWSRSVPAGPGTRGREVCVAPPTQAEQASIADGSLSNRGPAGRALGWVARDIARMKVGLALGSGSVRGFAHIGVLQVLDDAELPIDYLSGSSIGAPVAGMIATGDDPATILDKLRRVGTATFRPTLPRHAILSSSGVRDVMRRVWGNSRIEDLDIPLGIVAVDIESRRQVVFHSGLLWVAALASIAIPGVYPPVRIGHRTLVDGGVLNPVPIDVVASMGADHVIGVRLGDLGQTDRLEETAALPSAPSLSILQVLMRSIDAMQAAVNIAPSAVQSTVIEPKFPPSAGFPLRDFAQGAQYVEHGRIAAEQALDGLRGRFPWLS